MAQQRTLRSPQPGRSRACSPVSAGGVRPATRLQAAPPYADEQSNLNPGRSVAPSLLSAALIMLLGIASFFYGAVSNGDAFVVIAAVLIWLGARRGAAPISP